MNPNRIDRDTEQAVRRFLSLIAERYDMAGAVVYGSRARGAYGPDSDADVAVLLNGEHHLDQGGLTVKPTIDACEFGSITIGGERIEHVTC